MKRMGVQRKTDVVASPPLIFLSYEEEDQAAASDVALIESDQKMSIYWASVLRFENDGGVYVYPYWRNQSP